MSQPDDSCKDRRAAGLVPGAKVRLRKDAAQGIKDRLIWAGGDESTTMRVDGETIAGGGQWLCSWPTAKPGETAFTHIPETALELAVESP